MYHPCFSPELKGVSISQYETHSVPTQESLESILSALLKSQSSKSLLRFETNPIVSSVKTRHGSEALPGQNGEQA